jgi:hypothetical protein
MRLIARTVCALADPGIRTGGAEAGVPGTGAASAMARSGEAVRKMRTDLESRRRMNGSPQTLS